MFYYYNIVQYNINIINFNVNTLKGHFTQKWVI